jgi:hypothetical protein
VSKPKGGRAIEKHREAVILTSDTHPIVRKASKSFIKPTVDEVAAYWETRGNSMDPVRFWDFYESKGWVVGKSPMKDWQAAVRTWERGERGGTARLPCTTLRLYVRRNAGKGGQATEMVMSADLALARRVMKIKDTSQNARDTASRRNEPPGVAERKRLGGFENSQKREISNKTAAMIVELARL